LQTISRSNDTIFLTNGGFVKLPTSHYEGELYGGGVVFYVDQTGAHGLICSMLDLSTTQPWSNINGALIGTTAQSDWDGQGNTNAIIGQSGHTNSAAKLCNDYINVDYGTGVYSDWYLPANGQLYKLYNTIYEVNKALDSDGNVATTAIVKAEYWSSTEVNVSFAWEFSFYNTYIVSHGKSSSSYYTRAVRRF
jgi:hypothetical protein